MLVDFFFCNAAGDYLRWCLHGLLWHDGRCLLRNRLRGFNLFGGVAATILAGLCQVIGFLRRCCAAAGDGDVQCWQDILGWRVVKMPEGNAEDDDGMQGNGKKQRHCHSVSCSDR